MVIKTKQVSRAAALVCVAWVVASTDADARTITKVTIHASGLNANPNEKQLNDDCKRFRPTASQIRKFFTTAYSVPRMWAMQERYAPCYATGTIVFDGLPEANWSITSGGVGGLRWNDGDEAILFRRKNGWVDPTACTYGVGDKLEC